MKLSKGNLGLRRTAAEVKKYRIIMRTVPIALGCATLALTLLYAVTVMYSKYGSFTVMVNKFDNVKYALTLSETPDFSDPIGRLNCKASEEITNIDGTTLPQDLDMINGEHNGDNYVAYTFYCKNAGIETITYEYQLYIANMTLDIEKAVRVRLYVNGEATDYARTRTDGTGPEPGTTEFVSESVIARNQIMNFEPGAVTKYTVVIWLEGNDPECLDNILGGEFKIDMSMSIIGIEEEEE
jgi:hypothetical protein